MAEEEERTAPAEAGAMTARIGQAIMLHRAGDREEARNRLAQLWAETHPEHDLFHRCTIAHYLADTQEDRADELAWDQRAMAAAEALTGAEVHWGEHALAVRSLYPSLHLNLAADHAALGDERSARRELRAARSYLPELSEDGYGDGIRAAVHRLGLRLGDVGDEPGPPPCGGTDAQGR
ncbi:hypothetical protein [Streptomyces xiaopingdaonensis]|uniref:hypothetical protein n=1 Tax=Streptomyces xiaopingdaonensis TaxID=1565415 RepID=UPI000378CA21|nr:hypothetical protein [Streptomyces xiaopingdaonensis]